jgi:glutathione S-transferase
MKLYDYLDSGNGYKVRLLLALLARPYELVEVDILKGETRTPDFLGMNPNGRVPLLELDDGRHLAESNAILFYLAQDSRYLPNDPWDRAKVLQWLCFEQYSHEPYIATLRYWIRHVDLNGTRGLLAEEKRRGGEAALRLMNEHLSAHRFLVADALTIADIALYAYTHVANQAGFDLVRHPSLTRWLAEVANQPRYVPMF